MVAELRIWTGLYVTREFRRKEREKLEEVLGTSGFVTPFMLSIPDLSRLKVHDLLSCCRDLGVTLRLCEFLPQPLQMRDWDSAYGVLDPSEGEACSTVNPAEDFEILLPMPCGRGSSVLKRDVTLHLAEKPRDPFIYVGNRIVMSHRLANAINSNWNRLPVTFRGETMSYDSFDIGKTSSILSSESLASVRNCTACGTSLTPTKGIWFARRGHSPIEEIAVDEVGFDHLQLIHPVVVPRKVAERIYSMRLKRIVIAPVFDVDSAVYNAVKEFESAVMTLGCRL